MVSLRRLRWITPPQPLVLFALLVPRCKVAAGAPVRVGLPSDPATCEANA